MAIRNNFCPHDVGRELLLMAEEGRFGAVRVYLDGGDAHLAERGLGQEGEGEHTEWRHLGCEDVEEIVLLLHGFFDYKRGLQSSQYK